MQPVSFLEAIRFAQSRKIVLPDEFYKMDLKTRQLATTVSFLSSIEQVKQVIGLVNKAIASGTTFDQFKKDVAEKGIELSDHYLDLVFRQNVQSAYSAGRWQQQQRNKTKRPYLMYSAINDNRVRPSHLALDGIIRHIDDPFWLKYYPPHDFQCRCTTIALTETQALKRGVTPDDQVPDIGEPKIASIPQIWGDLSELTRQKTHDSGIDTRLFDNDLKSVEAEWTASKQLTSLLAPMNKNSRELFDTIADTVIPLDPTIRPSAIKTLIDYVQGNDSALTAYLSQKPISLADDVLRRWLIADMGAIHAVAANTTATVLGSSTIAYVSKLEVGKTVTLDHPMLFAETGGDIVLQIENATGLGIDLNVLNAGQGVLFPIGLSFEVVKIETIKGQLIYTLRALVN
ncbi:phage minor head protein [Acinetobacter ursingii]|uniref:phage head morphogenesis protein n=1 Tax=Acinetobacter ursingii TaxID=108980 RepID=UPI003AF6A538